MRRVSSLASFVCLSLLSASATAEVPVTRTVHHLPSSNGRGALMIDLNAARITHFRERLPATEEPVLDEQGKEVWGGSDFEVVKTRDLLLDAYFGLRTGGTQKWLTGLPVDRDASGYAPYVAGKRGGTGIATLVQRDGDLELSTYAFAPRALGSSGFVMLLKIKNAGQTTATNVGAFSLHNFHLGFGRPGVREETGANGETAVFHPAANELEERGFAGVVAARPLSPIVHRAAFGATSTGAGNAYEVVNNGGTADLVDLAGAAPTTDDTVTAYQFASGDLEPGAEVWTGVAFAHHGDPQAIATAQAALAAYVGQKTARQLFDTEVASWKAFQEARVVPPGLSPDEDALFRQSVAMLSMAQVHENEAFLREFLTKDGEPRRTRFGAELGGVPSTLPAVVKHRGNGAVIASLPPGEWTISWIRDASYAIAAMSEVGMKDEAKDALAFYLGAEANRFQMWDELKPYSMPPYQMSLVRYQGFGVEETDFNQFGPNLEFDGFGLFLWALRRYELASKDDTFTKANWPTISTKVGDAIVKLVDPSTQLLHKDSSIWETHWKGRERAWTYTNLTAAKGLCDASEMASHVGDTARATAYREAGIALRKAIAERLLTKTRALASNREELEAGDEQGCYDAAVIEGISMGLFDPQGSIAKATLAALDEHIAAPAGAGWSRNDDFKDHAGKDDLSPWGGQYDSAEWVITDLRGAIATRLVGDTMRSDRLIDWTVQQAKLNYLEVAETYDESSGVYKFNSPMVGFGAGAYVLALAQRGGLDEAPACGAYFDESTLPPLQGTGGSGGSGGAAGKSGSAGAAGKGGAAGKAGAAGTSTGGASSGGTGGGGGSEPDGSGGTGGTTAAGGNATSGSGGGGAAGSTGGKIPKGGGGGTAGGAGNGATSAAPSPVDDGCSCRVTASDDPARGGLAPALAAFALGTWCRRRARKRPTG